MLLWQIIAGAVVATVIAFTVGYLKGDSSGWARRDVDYQVALASKNLEIATLKRERASVRARAARVISASKEAALDRAPDDVDCLWSEGQRNRLNLIH